MIASLCPNGKELRFAYGHELAAWSGAYGRLAAVVPGDKMVGEVMVANDLVSLFKG
jgi:hypothetical protein